MCRETLGNLKAVPYLAAQTCIGGLQERWRIWTCLWSSQSPGADRGVGKKLGWVENDARGSGEKKNRAIHYLIYFTFPSMDGGMWYCGAEPQNRGLCSNQFLPNNSATKWLEILIPGMLNWWNRSLITIDSNQYQLIDWYWKSMTNWRWSFLWYMMDWLGTLGTSASRAAAELLLTGFVPRGSFLPLRRCFLLTPVSHPPHSLPLGLRGWFVVNVGQMSRLQNCDYLVHATWYLHMWCVLPSVLIGHKPFQS